MTATDELRRMLDERGVEWRGHGTTDRTWYEVGRVSWFIYERENKNLTADAVFLTPEQAIAATLSSTYEPPLACHWDGDVLVLAVPRDPSSIHVQRAKGQPRKVYSGESELISTHAVIVSDESTDCATGHCECELCGKPIDMWDKFCRRCGAKVLQPVVMGKGER